MDEPIDTDVHVFSWLNGPTFSGRAGTDQLRIIKDRDARPVRCNGWLSLP